MKDIMPKRDPKINLMASFLVKHYKSAKYGDKFDSFRSENMKSTSSNVKSLTSIPNFKEYIRTWFGPSCKSNICRMI